jgi:hypothetical protein
MTFFKLAGEAVLHLQGLDEVMNMDLGEIRRKADEVKRAKQAESKSASESGSEDSIQRKPVRKCSSSIESHSNGSQRCEGLVKSGSEGSGPDVMKKQRGRAALVKGSDSGSGKSSPRSRNITPPRRQDSGPASPAAVRKASIGSEGSVGSIDSEVKIPMERKASIGRSSSSDSRGSLSD